MSVVLSSLKRKRENVESKVDVDNGKPEENDEVQEQSGLLSSIKTLFWSNCNTPTKENKTPVSAGKRRRIDSDLKNDFTLISSSPRLNGASKINSNNRDRFENDVSFGACIEDDESTRNKPRSSILGTLFSPVLTLFGKNGEVRTTTSSSRKFVEINEANLNSNYNSVCSCESTNNDNRGNDNYNTKEDENANIEEINSNNNETTEWPDNDPYYFLRHLPPLTDANRHHSTPVLL